MGKYTILGAILGSGAGAGGALVGGLIGNMWDQNEEEAHRQAEMPKKKRVSKKHRAAATQFTGKLSRDNSGE